MYGAGVNHDWVLTAMDLLAFTVNPTTILASWEPVAGGRHSYFLPLLIPNIESTAECGVVEATWQDLDHEFTVSFLRNDRILERFDTKRQTLLSQTLSNILQNFVRRIKQVIRSLAASWYSLSLFSTVFSEVRSSIVAFTYLSLFAKNLSLHWEAWKNSKG